MKAVKVPELQYSTDISSFSGPLGLFGFICKLRNLHNFLIILSEETRLNWHHKTCLCSFDPFNPQFYIVKLGFTGVYIYFLISA